MFKVTYIIILWNIDNLFECWTGIILGQILDQIYEKKLHLFIMLSGIAGSNWSGQYQAKTSTFEDFLTQIDKSLPVSLCLEFLNHKSYYNNESKSGSFTLKWETF